MFKNRFMTAALIVITLAGAIVLTYPLLANAWNQNHATQVIAAYADEMNDVAEESYAALWAEAKRFNEKISANPGRVLTDELQAEYETVLNISGTGILGYIEIPKISVSLPIYRGTSESVLQIAAGHISWTNLPIGGEGTHCAISGHRGLASAKLFSDLPQLSIGDVFYVRVLNELMTYEVDQIVTVLPWELDELDAVRGKDYFTLITCTPYGINTHRLLVRGRRVGNAEEIRSVLVPADALRIEPLVVAPILAIPIILLLLIFALFVPERASDTIQEGKLQ